MKKPSVQWFAGLNDKDKKTYESLLNTKPMILRRLLEIIESDLKELNRFETKTDVYSSPSWPYLQAHLNGEKARLKKIADLLSFLN